MIRRIIEVASPSYLRLENKKLFIEQNHEQVAQIPIEDIGVLILENSAISITQPLVIECQKNNTTIVFCDERHLPYSIILPISEGNNLHHRILKQQINITEPTRKNLWKQIIKEKVQNQAKTLRQFDKNYVYLERLISKIRSGDSSNIEGLAAQYYWKELFGKGFIRDQDADGVNAILNYGYAIIRTMVARGVVASGLHPAIGLFHHNQYNGLCLVDDLMEPFRPWVDSIACNLHQQNNNLKITREIKKPFLNLISKNISFKNKSMPLMVSVHYLMADLKRNFTKESKKLIYPRL